MGIFDGILIVSDIDGTFLGKNSRVVPENIEAIEYFKSEGGRFTFATGRIAFEVVSLTPQLDRLVNAPMILANGAYMYDLSLDRIVSANYMNGEATVELAKFLRENYADLGFRVSRPAGFLTDGIVGMLKGDLVGERREKTTVLPLSEWGSQCTDFYKMVIRGKDSLLDELRPELIRRFGTCFDHCKSGPTIHEVLSAGCSKAAMLAELRAHIEEKEGKRITVYACGDFENDIPMLSAIATDIAACPDNALDEVKEICSLKLCNCDDGFIADLIYNIKKTQSKTCRN